MGNISYDKLLLIHFIATIVVSIIVTIKVINNEYKGYCFYNKALTIAILGFLLGFLWPLTVVTWIVSFYISMFLKVFYPTKKQCNL